jgi:hypothetical protein
MIVTQSAESRGVQPTTALVLSHQHPDDYQQIAATIENIRRIHRPFSTRHRIIDAHGRTREVIVIGEQLTDGSGEVAEPVVSTLMSRPVGVKRLADYESAITEMVAEIAEHQPSLNKSWAF